MTITTTANFTEHLLSVKHNVNRLMYIHPLLTEFSQQPYQIDTIIAPFYRWRNASLEKLSNLLKPTYVVNVRAKIPTWVCRSQEPGPLASEQVRLQNGGPSPLPGTEVRRGTHAYAHTLSQWNSHCSCGFVLTISSLQTFSHVCPTLLSHSIHTWHLETIHHIRLLLFFLWVLGENFSLPFNSPFVFYNIWFTAHCFHCNLNLVITFFQHNSTLLNLDLRKLHSSVTLPGTQNEISGSNGERQVLT